MIVFRIERVEDTLDEIFKIVLLLENNNLRMKEGRLSS